MKTPLFKLMLIAVLGLLNTTIVLAQHDHGEHDKPNKLSIQVGHLFDIYSDLQQALSKDDQKLVYKYVINLDKMFKSVDVKIIKKSETLLDNKAKLK